MKKAKLDEKVGTVITDTKTALQILWDNINRGQQKQLIKIGEIKELFDRYGVEYGGNT